MAGTDSVTSSFDLHQVRFLPRRMRRSRRGDIPGLVRRSRDPGWNEPPRRCRRRDRSRTNVDELGREHARENLGQSPGNVRKLGTILACRLRRERAFVSQSDFCRLCVSEAKVSMLLLCEPCPFVLQSILPRRQKNHYR